MKLARSDRTCSLLSLVLRQILAKQINLLGRDAFPVLFLQALIYIPILFGIYMFLFFAIM